MNTDNTIAYTDCNVKEEMFPCMGKCCDKNESVLLNSYKRICPFCRISDSLPYGTNLMVTTIFECLRYAYGRRVSE